MASTLLAVDDSVTMRKVLEITFAGPDFRVVTAASPDDALQKLKADKPALVITDVTLEPKNGYDLCKSIKQASPGTFVLILSSKQSPYDAAKGSAAQADDHMDKPFDTQQMIDKVKKLLEGGKPAGAAVSPPAAAAVGQSPMASTRVSSATTPSPVATPARQPAVAPIAAAPAPAPVAAAATPQRAKTLIGQYSPGQAPVAAAPAQANAAFSPTPVTGVPMQPRMEVPAAAMRTAVSAPSPVAAQVNGHMASKLEDLGLSSAQVEAVMALSRDVVERVVWEVVPVLAETLIKEEIARLTK